MDIRLWDGREGQACVTGRDDDIGLALLKPSGGAAHVYDYLALSGEAPPVGQRLDLLDYSSFKPTLAQRSTNVVGHESSDNGHGFILVDAADSTTAAGAVLADETGRMVGMRMPTRWLLQNRIADPGDVIAIDAPAIANVALPALRSGRMHVRFSKPTNVDSFPYVPIIFHGEITVDGEPTPVGARVHAKVSEQGRPDHWQSTSIGMLGEYVLPVPIGPSARIEEIREFQVEFWVGCKRFSTTVVVEEPAGKAVEQALAF